MNVLSFSGAAVLFLLFATAAGAWVRERKRSAELTRRLNGVLEQRSEDQTALDKRRELDRIKDEFISTVSHELRTPLTSIRGALGLLSSGVAGQVDAKAQNLLRIANTNTDRLVRLINDILDLQRMDSGQAPLHLRHCLLPDLAVQAADTMQSMAEAAGVRIEVVPVSEGAQAGFDGDPDRMLQVLCNLLSNAIKFSQPGTAVRLVGGVDGSDLLLRVEDQGRGVPADKLESIFDRFGQVDPSDSRQKGGTGLGLAICRAIVQQHNGHIWAERNAEREPGAAGVTFYVRLPRLQSTDHPPVLPAGSVLVVDDDAGVREVVGEQLRRHGYSVLEADSGERALLLAGDGDIEAILLDLYMPGMSGWETLDRLKTNATTAKIPVVVLSVLAPGPGTSAERRRRTDHAGTPLQEPLSPAALPQGWVQKPFEERSLLSELARVLRGGSDLGRILLVEDDEVLAAVISASLARGEGERFGVQHVSTLSNARSQCLMAPPDLIILDLTLPDGDGFAFVEWLRSQPDLRLKPLVVFSGQDVSDAQRIQLRLGPTQFLTKAQVHPSEVHRVVMNVMRNLRPQSEPPVVAQASQP